MKKTFFLLLILSSIAYTQSSWKPEVNTTINVNYLQNMDIFTNKDGNHVLVNNFNTSTGVKTLNYNLLNSSGLVVRSYLIESITNGTIEFPKISGDDNNIYAVYRLGGAIKIWKSTDIGLSFQYKTAIQVSNNTCMGVETDYNSYGLHVVWSNKDKGTDYATYYYRYTNEGNLVDFKEVTDFTNGNGGRPTISLSDYKIHVSFDMGHGDLGTNFGLAFTRDKYYSSQNWETEQQATTFSVMATKAAIKSSQLFLFYFLSVSDLGQYHSDLYVKTRDINGTTWSSPTLIKSWCDVTELVKVKMSNNGNLNLVYKSGFSLYWRTYNGSVWSNETLISGYPRNSALSFVFNDLFLVSNSGMTGGNIFYRQYDSYPSAPQNLVLTNNGGHPRLTWPQNIDADIAYYKIYRNVGNGGWTSLDTTSNLYYDDQTISICTSGNCCSLQYQISAIDNSGLESQNYSNIVIARTPGGEYKTKGTDQNEVITNYSLSQNFPNPFNPTTKISYQLPKDGIVQLRIYNLLGQEVAVPVNEFKSEGKYSVDFNAAGLSSGIYIYSLKVNDFVQNQKMTLLK